MMSGGRSEKKRAAGMKRSATPGISGYHMFPLTPATNRNIPSPQSAQTSSGAAEPPEREPVGDMMSAFAAIDAAMEKAPDASEPGFTGAVRPDEERRRAMAVAGYRSADAAAATAFAQPARPRSLPPEAEFRSRLSWFLAVSDPGALDPGSLTYEPAFGLREKPFSLSSDPRFFFTRSAHGAAFNTLAAGIRRREGILVLTGEVGTGKTTLCRAVLQSLDQKTFAAFVADPFLSREDLLKTLLVDFGVVSVDEIRRGVLRGATRADLCYPLYDFLASLQPLKAFAVVMIDEAQNLTPELLEEVRILSDLESRQKLLEVFLIGQPELETRLAAPSMRQLAQRVAIRCDLPSLPLPDVGAYVAHRLAVAGNDGRVRFTESAIELVHSATAGIPRVINLVCDRALMRASRMQTTRVDADHVAWGIGELKLPVSAAPMIALVHSQAEPKSPRDTPLSEQTEAASRATESLPAPASLVQTIAVMMPDTPAPETAEAAAPEPAQVTSAVENDPFDTGAAIVEETPVLPELPTPVAEAFEPATEQAFVNASDPWSRRKWLAVGGAGVALAGTLLGSRFWMTSVAAPSSSTLGQPAVTTVQSAPAGPPAETAAVQPPAPPAAQERFAILIATFQSEERTAKSLEELRAAGFTAFSTDVPLRDGARAQAVFLGPYGDQASAERDLARSLEVPGYAGGRIVSVKPPGDSTTRR
jgi:general secretion pathway protein A